MSVYQAITTKYIGKINSALKNGTKAPSPTKVIFGGGGFNTGTNEIKPVNPDDIVMDAQYITKDFQNVYADGDFMIYVGMLDRNDLNNYRISQIGVLDSASDLMVKINCYEQLKVAGTPMTVKIKLPF